MCKLRKTGKHFERYVGVRGGSGKRGIQRAVSTPSADKERSSPAYSQELGDLVCGVVLWIKDERWSGRMTVITIVVAAPVVSEAAARLYATKRISSLRRFAYHHSAY